MELDKRIKSIDDIQSIICNDLGFIGCKGYFFDNFVQAKDLTKCHYGTLVDINGDSDDHCFKATDKKGYYRFFIPESSLTTIKKNYRPFTIKEFIQKYPVGSVFKIRLTRERLAETCVQYVGYKIYEDKIYLGITDFTLDELFENFEMIEPNGDTWIPFGIKE